MSLLSWFLSLLCSWKLPTDQNVVISVESRDYFDDGEVCVVDRECNDPLLPAGCSSGSQAARFKYRAPHADPSAVSLGSGWIKRRKQRQRTIGRKYRRWFKWKNNTVSHIVRGGVVTTRRARGVKNCKLFLLCCLCRSCAYHHRFTFVRVRGLLVRIVGVRSGGCWRKSIAASAKSSLCLVHQPTAGVIRYWPNNESTSAAFTWTDYGRAW